MNKIIYILFIGLFIGFTSCSDDSTFEEFNFDSESTSSRAAKCCQDYIYDITSTEGDGECCNYEVRFVNNGECNYSLIDRYGNIFFENQPGNSQITNLSLCADDPTLRPDGCKQFYIQGNTEESVCESFDLCADCKNECCDQLSVDIIKWTPPVGIDDDCCIFMAIYENPSDCLMRIFSKEGKVISAIPANNSGVIFFEACTDDETDNYVTIGPGILETCLQVPIASCGPTIIGG